MSLRKTLIALAVAGSSAGAQAVRGVVVDAGNQPVPGVVVFIVDSTSAVVGRSLSNEAGEFRVAATRAGTYRLRTMRIGYRPTTTDAFALLLGGEIEKRVSLSGALVSLDTVRVVDRNSCRVTSDATAAATFAVLEQARTALSAAQLTMAGRTISATTTSYERTLEPDGRRVTQQSSRTATAYVAQPWRAIGPDSVHRAGFVSVGDDNSTTYFAPSIDVLLSNAFVEDHCFRLVSDRKQPNVVGVAFEPSSERKKIPEIKGTLWVDKRTAELQRLDYRYVNILKEQENAAAGGDVSFGRMKNGGWVISRWTIRMPVLEQLIRDQALGGTKLNVAAIQVAGGEVMFATRARGGVVDTLWSKPGPALNGVVVDSARGQPIANARVDLVGADLSGTTDSRGRFSIRNVLPGTYLVETATPELSAIGAANQSTITFEDSTESHEIRVPTAAQLVASLCAGRTLSSSEAAVVGRVHERGDTLPAVGARVVAEWTVVTLRDEHGIVGERTGRRIEGKTSPDGTFRLCGVPSSTTITIAAMMSTASSDPKMLFTGSRIVRADLSVDRSVSLTAKFSGKVLLDSIKTPIENAEIFFPELSKVGRSRANGAFLIDSIPAGEQHVIVRRVGYGVLDTKLTFRANTTVDREIFLNRVALLDSVVTTDRMTLNVLRDFEDNRRVGLGHFLDRAQLAQQTPDTKVPRLLAQWPGLSLFGRGTHVWMSGTRKGPPLCEPKAAATCFEGHGFYVPDPIGYQMGQQISCYAQVYVNGALMNRGHPTPPFDIGYIYADQVEAVEWYAGSAETPARYSDLNSACGVLVVHLRRTP
jgi:hypothetical protein